MTSMDTDSYEEQQVQDGILTGIKFNVSTDADHEMMSVMEIEKPSQVSDPRLGFPNLSKHCTTCDARDLKHCEGHFGVTGFEQAILHPYYLSEVVQILNKICPGCKSIRKDPSVEGDNSVSRRHQRECKYCVKNPVGRYPRMKFKISPTDLFSKSSIMVEISEKSKVRGSNKIPEDYWNFIPNNQEQGGSTTPNRKVLSHDQVHDLLKDVDPELIKKFVPDADSIFINSFPVTPNSHRVAEIMFQSTTRLIFDDRTQVYKKLVNCKGTDNELSACVLECLKSSKLHPEKPSNDENDLYRALTRNKDPSYNMSGLKYMKDVLLGKRTDNCFRMVVTGNPSIKLSEIGIPCHVAERLLTAEQLNRWNEERLKACCSLRILEKGEIRVRREGELVTIRQIKKVRVGDTIYRPLIDGDIVLINRPPSIHQHSLIALTVKVLPVNASVSINPLICSPLRGDFDGDCLHGYVPQSIETRVELSELVSLDKQLINGQSGRNLLSLGHDSLTAAYLVNKDGVLLKEFEMQQLEMFCPNRSPSSPEIIKAPSSGESVWTGKQLLGMLFPPELMSLSNGSTWLRDGDQNIFQSLAINYKGKFLDILHAAQEVLCEWLSMRGMSVSLLDLYLSSNSNSRKNMMAEISNGLQEAELTCNYKQLMVDSFRDFLAGTEEECDSFMGFEVGQMCYEKQRSAAVSQLSVDTFKQAFRDIQNLLYGYANKDNSILTMFKAGSKGNLMKLVQQNMCLGLQHSLAPLSFRFPPELSCDGWNNLKSHGLTQNGDDTVTESAKNFIPYAVVESSFMKGLNAVECFVHSVTSRDSSFSDHAVVPGMLSRKLMFFMRDICAAYDGTVRNAYGNQVVQFYYGTDKGTSSATSSPLEIVSQGSSLPDGIGGQPVGSLSASAISEAAYGALDQPVSLLEASPLLNLKTVLECGSKRSDSDQTMTLYLSKTLGWRLYGPEYAALEIKNHLERLLFSDIVSTVLIIYSPQKRKHFSPWVCHFHISKDAVRKRGLSMHSIIDSLRVHCKNDKRIQKIKLPELQITSNACGDMSNEDDTYCINVTVVECSKSSRVDLDVIPDTVIPFLLEAAVKGFPEIKKVHILWKDPIKVSDSRKTSRGELYLRVAVSGDSGITNLWGALKDDCLPMMDLIDWSRSHPDEINQFSAAYGIDAGWKFFRNKLERVVSDTGKTILNEHLHLVANSLSMTGEFVGLTSKGLRLQRETASVASPFMQACFSNPSVSFVKAAKKGISDDLKGTIDALAWGKAPRIGTGGHFEMFYSLKDQSVTKPVDVYDMLGDLVGSQKHDVEFKVPKAPNVKFEEYGSCLTDALGGSSIEKLKKIETMTRSVVREHVTLDDIKKLSQGLREMLHKKPINQRLSETERRVVMMALYFHPQRDEKIGSEIRAIKVGYHPEHVNSRCFILERTDGTVVDFSYHKCIIEALKIVAPHRVESYKSKRLLSGNM